jgi:hypothetical protein
MMDSVALYWDFENIHASLLDADQGQGAYLASRFRPQEPVVDIEAIMEFALSLGTLAINRAFANWVSFHRYKQSLLQSAIELIQVFPPGANAKNGADIKLCLDVMDDMARFPHIGTIIVVGGDSDFMPLSYKVKAAGRRLVGVGVRRNTNQHWARSCTDFRFYESLVAEGAVAPEEVPALTLDVVARPAEPIGADQDPAVDLEPTSAMAISSHGEPDEGAQEGQQHDAQLLPISVAEVHVRKALKRLLQGKGEEWTNKAALRPFIKRLDATFHEANFGFDSFSQLLDAMPNVVEIRKGKFDHEVRLVPKAD